MFDDNQINLYFQNHIAIILKVFFLYVRNSNI